MNYFIDLFSPSTYQFFSSSNRSISGFRLSQKKLADKIHPGDKLVSYVTQLSRWVGVLEVLSDCLIDATPIFVENDDPFVVRFKVKPIIWLDLENAIPIHENDIWNSLSFTKSHVKTSSGWTGRLRNSLGLLEKADGQFLEETIKEQEAKKVIYPFNIDLLKDINRKKIKATTGLVTVTIPAEEDYQQEHVEDKKAIRESLRIQSLIAGIGEKLGFSIWIPRNDRGRVILNWNPKDGTLLEALPLNYDEVTLKTIEQIDVIWLRRRSIVRVFEIEHTTAVYSGILRMADLLALQPNMDINLHIVAPLARKDKVFQEIQRPVFSLLEKGALSELCSYLSYESISQISALSHLDKMIDTVIEDYEEYAE